MAENQRRQDQASNRRNARPLKGASSQVHSRRDMVSDHSQTLNRTFVGTNVSRQTVGRPLRPLTPAPLPSKSLYRSAR